MNDLPIDWEALAVMDEAIARNEKQKPLLKSMTPEQLRDKLDQIISEMDEIFSLVDWIDPEKYPSLSYNLDMLKHHADESIEAVDSLL